MEPTTPDPLARLTAGPVTVTHDGVDWQLAPLTLRDIASLDAYIRRHVYAEAAKLIAIIREAEGPEEHVDQVWADARWAAKYPRASSFAQDYEPFVHTVWLALKHNHPDVPRDQAAAIVESDQLTDALYRVLLRQALPDAAVEQLVRTLAADPAVRARIGDILTEMNRIDDLVPQDDDGQDAAGNPQAPTTTTTPTPSGPGSDSSNG